MRSSNVLEAAPAIKALERAEPARRPSVAAPEATVLLVDGRPLVRECLAHALRAEWSAAQITTSGWDRLDGVAGDEGVDLCVACEAGAGEVGIDRLSAAFPSAALVVISDDQRYASIARAAGQGARGYFSTSIELRVLVQALRLVLVGGTALPVAVTLAPEPAAAPTRAPASPALSRFSAELFTPKELEVLRSLASGRQNKLIAHELAICETTVKVHLRHIFRKLGTTNRTHAALLARDLLEVPTV
jgi:DNA-binding NarL/FixJ family response regulator